MLQNVIQFLRSTRGSSQTLFVVLITAVLTLASVAVFAAQPWGDTDSAEARHGLSFCDIFPGLSFCATATPQGTPTETSTPTDTPTPTDTATPTNTPSKRDLTDLRFTTMIGGSTGVDTLFNCCNSYIPMFDAFVTKDIFVARHVILPGAVTHLVVRTDPALDFGTRTFIIQKNGLDTDVSCTIPIFGNFCEAGDKGDCAQFEPGDTIQVSAPAIDHPFPRMSWVAKLDLYAKCP